MDEKNVPDVEAFDYSQIDSLALYTGHPNNGATYQ